MGLSSSPVTRKSSTSLVSPVTYGGKELTGTALFLYGMSWGINNGILKAKKYRPVCDRAWKALVNDCVHADGFLGYVQGTGCFLLGAAEYYKLVR